VSVISIKNIDVTFTLSILIIFCLPSYIFVTFLQDSLAPGLLLASTLVILINNKELFSLRVSLFRIIPFGIVSLFMLLSALSSYLDNGSKKPIFSFFGLMAVFLTATVFSGKLDKMSFQKLESSLLMIILLFLSLGWVAVLTPITWGEYGALPKSVFPFSEQSHYALSIGLLTTGYATVGRKSIIFFIIINMFLLSLVFPNLTLLVSLMLVLFSSCIRLNGKYFKYIFLAFPLISLISLIIISSKVDYFASRIVFEDSTNLTTLVFLQGWYLAFINTLNTNGLGLGFQMLGMPGTHLTPYSEAIVLITGSITNLTDGGLLAAKLIAEFGIVGLIICFLYIIFTIDFLFKANRLWGTFSSVSIKKMESIKKYFVLRGLLFGFFTEVFFRGYGYFSPGLLVVAAVLISNYNPPNPTRYLSKP